MKYSFLNDYSEGAHEKIIKTLCDTNLIQTVGYGEDDYCERARALIKRRLENEVSSVHFMLGGTQTNLTVAAAVLRPHQGIVCADTAHIAVHESGAIEATGHKVLTMPNTDGKITAKAVGELIKAHFADSNAEHCVQPGMVYISQPTELGTVYSKKELVELSKVCHKYNVPLYMDGARLGCALACEECGVALSDLTELTDIFYIGGTKMGALFGEALVINNPAYDKDFRYIKKQRGAMLAKGRLLGLQFEALFSNDLYMQIARHSNAMAKRLGDGLAALGFEFYAKTQTNQVFPIMTKELVKQLKPDYILSVWQDIDEQRAALRLCTSWATAEKAVDEFLADLKSVMESL